MEHVAKNFAMNLAKKKIKKISVLSIYVVPTKSHFEFVLSITHEFLPLFY